MAYHSNMDRMQTMHIMCKRELEQLQANLSKFLVDSEVVMRNDIFRSFRKESGPTHANVFGLMAYDRYMSRVASITNLARKFNIHLQLHNLNKILTADVSMGLAPDHNLLEEFFEWHKVLRDNGDECLDYGGDWKQFGSEDVEGSGSTIALADAIHSSDKVNKEKYPVVRKITFATPESLMLESIPPCVQLRDLSAFVAGYHFAAFITYIDNMDTLTFYACQMRNDMLYELSNMLKLPKSVRMPPMNVVFGISINSKNILRGVLQTAESASAGHTDENLCVLLIDYGELVPLISNEVQFYDLPKVYRDLPAQAMKCILLGVKEGLYGCRQTEACVLGEKLRKYEFKEVTFEVIRKTGRVLYVYINEYREIEQKKPEDKKITSASNNPFVNSFDDNSNTSILPQNVKFGSNNDLKFLLTPRIDEVFKNDIIYLEVMHIARPDSFYGQILKDKSEQLAQLFWNTDEMLLDQKLTEPLKLGDIILAQYAKDEFWYRAKIIDIFDNDIFKVFYVDYGNTETVPLKSMAKCNNAQEMEPFRAILCRFEGLTDITNGDESRFQQAVQMLVVTLLNQRIEVKVEEKISNEELSVNVLDIEFAETRQMLVNLGHAKEVL